MSDTSDTKVEEFLKKVEEDQALQAELAKALEAGNEREAVTALLTLRAMTSPQTNFGLESKSVKLNLSKRKLLVNFRMKN